MDRFDWHERYRVQANWTKPLREFLYQQIGMNRESRVLEIGCGSGVILSELATLTRRPPVGLDIDFNILQVDASQNITCANAESIPFSAGTFDFVFAHYVLLWMKHADQALAEVKRVLKHGGIFAALAEPDYQGRIDSPLELERLGELQTKALVAQGIDPSMGRKLPYLLNEAGFREVDFGVSGFQTESRSLPNWFESEWNTIRMDLSGLVDQVELQSWFELDLRSRKEGNRVLWVPTFYALGSK